jgi:hypothetical protein
MDWVHSTWTGRSCSGPPWTEAAQTREHGDALPVAGARVCWCSPAMVEEDESDEAVPEGCSPEHVRWRRGSATEAKNGGGLSSSRG